MDMPPILMMAAALAAGVWSVLLTLRMPLLYGCLACLLAVSCFGTSFGSFDVGSLTFSADRVLLASMLPFFFLKRLLTPQPRIRLEGTDFVLVTFIGLLLVSVFSHELPPKSEVTPTPLFLFLVSFVMPSMVYWVTRLRMPTDSDSHAVCGFFVAFGLYLAWTAMCEEFHLVDLVFPRYILSPRSLYLGRSVGPFGSSPVLGTWLTMGAVSLIVMRGRMRIGTVVIALVLAFLAYAQYLTRTRSAWLGFAVAVPLAFLLTSGRLQRRMLLVSGISLACLVAIGLGEDLLSPRRAEGQAIVAYSRNQRLALLQRSVALFVRRPVMGWGFRQFEYVSRTQGGGGPLQIVSPNAAEGLASHNTLLRFVVETGIVGTTALCAIFGLWLQRAYGAVRSHERGSCSHDLATLFLCGLIAYWSEAMFHDVTFMMHENLLIWFLAGCLPGVGLSRSAECSIRTRSGSFDVALFGLLAPKGQPQVSPGQCPGTRWAGIGVSPVRATQG